MLVSSVVPSIVLGALLLREAHASVSLRSALAAGGVALGIALPLSAWFARRISRPVSSCVRGALDIARGRFGREIPVAVRNEIGELAYTFNHMSRELKSYDHENRRLIAALEAGYLATLRGLASAIDAKDPSTRGHSQRVAELAVAVGRELGAAFGINYRTQNLTEEVMKITGKRGVDVVFENIADPELFPKALASLRRGGKLLTAGAHGGPVVPLNVSTLYMNALSVIGTTEHTEDDLHAAFDAARQERLKILIDRVLPLSEAVEAHRIVAARTGTGKVLLTP